MSTHCRRDSCQSSFPCGCQVLDFGAGPVHVPTRWTELPGLTAWHKRVSARPSVRMHANPHIKGEQRYAAYKDNGVWRPRPKL